MRVRNFGGVLVVVLIARIVQAYRDFTDDDNLLTFNLSDSEYNEQPTFINVNINDEFLSRKLLIDMSSYRTIIFDDEELKPPTEQIIYRNVNEPLDVIRDEVTLKLIGTRGPLNSKDSKTETVSVPLEIYRGTKTEEHRALKFDGILGIASFQDDDLISPYSFLKQLVKNGKINYESFRLDNMVFNDNDQQYQSTISFGFENNPSTEKYLLADNPIPKFSKSLQDPVHIYDIIIKDVGLKDVDILNYFDISDYDDWSKNKSSYSEVILDSAVPFIQLPDKVFGYFHKTFFDDNCHQPINQKQASCSCVGSDYGGLPSINFKFKDYLRYTIEPEDYMTPPRINVTTREPYCSLGVYSYWNDTHPDNVGFGRYFFNRFKLFVKVDRVSGIYTVGFEKGESYRSLALILPTVLYYVIVIGILITLAIWLSIKKYRRLEAEKKKEHPLLQPNEKVEDLKDVSKALRKMDFNMNMSAYNKVFERQGKTKSS